MTPAVGAVAARTLAAAAVAAVVGSPAVAVAARTLAAAVGAAVRTLAAAFGVSAGTSAEEKEFARRQNLLQIFLSQRPLLPSYLLPLPRPLLPPSLLLSHLLLPVSTQAQRLNLLSNQL